MNSKINKALFFFKKDIWNIERKDVSLFMYSICSIYKVLYFGVSAFFDKKIMKTASSLTYSTMLAIVPIVAVVFGIAKGFGFSVFVEKWFKDSLSGHQQAAEIITEFVNSYLANIHGGVIVGVGLITMIYTVINLTANIEEAFNHIWQVKEKRSLFRTFTDYTAALFIIPIVIIFVSGISIFISTINDTVSEYYLLAPFVKIAINIMPYVVMSLIFFALYTFMPNTNVKWKNIIIPSIFSGVLMQILQLLYVHSQMWFSSYNAIYGSFAAIPLFMIWLQWSWTICLFGVDLCYSSQNLEKLVTANTSYEISYKQRLTLSIKLLSVICKRFENGEKPYTALELKTATGVHIRIIKDLLYDMQKTKILNAIANDNKDKDIEYQPATDINNLNVAFVIEQLINYKHTKEDKVICTMNNNHWNDVCNVFNKGYEDLKKILVKDL